MSDRPLRVAVVGSGPSGIYTADALTAQSDQPVAVDVLDRLPVPYGLVRYGVAPDHLSIRSVRNTLERVLCRPGVRFLGNVEVGSQVSLTDLHRFYDAVVLTYGAASDRQLGIPGEGLFGSLAATDFVAWYTGHPHADRTAIESALDGVTSAVVVGVGNVAIDVTRILAKTHAELSHTDMPQHVLDVLSHSSITDVHLLGRRGPAQAAFTTKELRELGELTDADVVVDRADLELDPGSAASVAAGKVLARNYAVLQKWSTRELTGKPRRIHVRFLTRPVEVTGDERVAGVVTERTRLDETAGVVGTGEFATIDAQLIVRSVGYRGLPMPGAPFDARRNVIPSEAGRVLDGGIVVPGDYVAGWIKRGPTGIIGTNKKDAGETVDSLLADAAAGALPPATEPEPAAFDALLKVRGIRTVSYAGWQAIDAAEIALGATTGRDRTTLHDIASMLAACDAQGV